MAHKVRMKQIIYILMAFVLMSVVTAIDVTDCAILDVENGIYELQNNIFPSDDERCIQIVKKNITFDGNNFVIDGTGSTLDWGFFINTTNSSVSNIQIINTTFGHRIWLTFGTNGIAFSNFTNFTISGSECLVGFGLQQGSKNVNYLNGNVNCPILDILFDSNEEIVLLNVTYNKSRTTFNFGGGLNLKFIQKWYFRPLVNDTFGKVVENAKVIALDRFNQIHYWDTAIAFTDSNGIADLILTEFEYENGNFFRYSNYTAYAKHPKYTTSSKLILNVTDNILDEYITLFRRKYTVQIDTAGVMPGRYNFSMITPEIDMPGNYNLSYDIAWGDTWPMPRDG